MLRCKIQSIPNFRDVICNLPIILYIHGSLSFLKFPLRVLIKCYIISKSIHIRYLKKILFYHLKSYFIIYTILFYITPNISNSIFFPNLFKYIYIYIYILLFHSLFLFLSFSLCLQHQPQQMIKKNSHHATHQHIATPTYPNTTHEAIKPKPHKK